MSLSVNGHFTLIEARFNDDNSKAILFEMSRAEVDHIDVLHITSWDEDHCNASELERILKYLKPELIEYPSYEPHTECGQNSKALIENYRDGRIRKITPTIVSASERKVQIGRDTLFNPIVNNPDSKKDHDNSIVKIFRVGSFQILSLGDCEDKSISERLIDEKIIAEEVDVLILAHHGSANSINTPEFLDVVMPSFAICPVDRENVHNHPDQDVRNWLNNRKIPYLTTKDGDVLVKTLDRHQYVVFQKRKEGWVKHNDAPFRTKTYYPNDQY